MSSNSKVILITGAASGIGEAVAIRFASEQANLSLLDINKEDLEKVSKKCEELQAKVLQVVVNITNDTDLKKAVDQTIKEYKKLDVVFNCAGISEQGLLTDANLLQVYDNVMNVNLRSIIAMTNYTIEELAKTKGCIINMASILSSTIYLGQVAYNVSKAGVVHFTKCAALELAEKGIRVNCVSPGPIKTNLANSTKIIDINIEKFWESLTKSSPLKEAMKIEEIAELVVFLSSDKATSITGSEFVIDAGFSLLGWAHR